MFIRTCTSTLQKNFIGVIRAYPFSFFIGNLLSVFYTIFGAYFIYMVMFQGKVSSDFIKHSQTKDYMTYVVIGSLVFTLIVRTLLNVSRTMITEIREGTIDSLLLTPFNRLGYFCGSMMQQTVTTLLELIISLIICIPFGINFSNFNFFTFILGIVLSLYCYFGLALCLGAIMIYTRDTYISQNTFFLTIFLICGVIYPTEFLPYPIQMIGKLLPINDSISVMRSAIMNGDGIRVHLVTFAKLIMYGSTYVFIGLYSIKKLERTVIEKILS